VSRHDAFIPAWGVILVALLGFVGGLLVTVLKFRHDRSSDLHRRGADALEELLAAVESWFEVVAAAIESRWEHLYQTDDSDPAVAAANEKLSEARSSLHRLALILSPDSEVVARGVGVVTWLQMAIDEIDAWPPVPDDAAADAADDEDDEDDDYDVMGEAFQESYDEAHMARSMALSGLVDFVRSANRELERGAWPFHRR
jgi:hypothetical protein